MHFANLRKELGDEKLADELGHDSMQQFQATIRMVEDADESMPKQLKRSIGKLASAYQMKHS